MKKTLVSALTTALVVGAASTTFAAANPFADVPADHWAYDAVVQLAQDGIVNGYLDGTFNGDQNMTRYEMAQIVAKAMAKAPVASNNDKAIIDKLAAEFSDELANLGVRVADLEDKVDNLKNDGFIRYAYRNVDEEDSPETSNQEVVLRLNTTMKINDQWTGHSRVEYRADPNLGTDVAFSTPEDGNGSYQNYARINKLYADATFGDTTVTIGRFGAFDNAGHGLAMDNNITGVGVAGKLTDELSYNVNVGRMNGWGANPDTLDGTQTYMGGDVVYTNGNFDMGVGYHLYNGSVAGTKTAVKTESKMASTVIGAGYKMGDFYATADYAMGSEDGLDGDSDAYNFQVNYKGVDAATPGSWGAYVGYQKLNGVASQYATYDLNWCTYEKGFKVGFDYALAKNITLDAQYFMGENTKNDHDYNHFFGHVTFAF